MASDIDLLGGHPLGLDSLAAEGVRALADGKSSVVEFADDRDAYVRDASAEPATDHVRPETDTVVSGDRITLTPAEDGKRLDWHLVSHRWKGFDMRVKALGDVSYPRVQVPHGDDLDLSGQADFPQGQAVAVVVPDPSSSDGRGMPAFVVARDARLADAH